MATDIMESLIRAKEQQLLNRYFGYKGCGVGNSGETIGNYTKDLPLKIEDEFREYLGSLWQECTGETLILDEPALRQMMTEDDREAVEAAYDDAARRTLWERITRSNHEDVTYYKGLLYEYTKDLLLVMRTHFLEKVAREGVSSESCGK